MVKDLSCPSNDSPQDVEDDRTTNAPRICEYGVILTAMLQLKLSDVDSQSPYLYKEINKYHFECLGLWRAGEEYFTIMFKMQLCRTQVLFIFKDP